VASQFSLCLQNIMVIKTPQQKANKSKLFPWCVPRRYGVYKSVTRKVGRLVVKQPVSAHLEIIIPIAESLY